MEHLQDYTFDSIIMRDDFISCIEKTDSKAVDFWESLCNQHPEIKLEFEKASTLYFHFKSHHSQLPSEEVREKVFKKLIKQINADEDQYQVSGSSFLYNFIRIAAVFIALISITAVVYYYFNSQKAIHDIVYNEIIVPSGEKSKVILSDGTTVWLNSESKLKYPANFEENSRKVFLEGEGYFDVAKRKGSKFYVFSQNLKIEVLGTVFNVKSYPDDKTIETTVVEGSVKVQLSGKSKDIKEVILKPTERIVYYKEKEALNQETATTEDKIVSKTPEKKIEPINPITIQQVNTKNITSWKDHLLVFDNETLENIAVKMSRWYRTEVVIKDEKLKIERFTGKFVHNETVYQVLKAINLTTPISYEVLNDKVIINKKNRKIKL